MNAIVNPLDYASYDTLYRFSFGAASQSTLYVWDDNAKSASSQANDWLQNNAPGRRAWIKALPISFRETKRRGDPKPSLLVVFSKSDYFAECEDDTEREAVRDAFDRWQSGKTFRRVENRLCADCIMIGRIVSPIFPSYIGPCWAVWEV